MPVKREMSFGLCQESSYTAITLNPESNFTRRKKNHLYSLKNIDVTRATQTTLDVMKGPSMIIGISMDQEICLILEQVSLSLLYQVTNLQMDTSGPGRD